MSEITFLYPKMTTIGLSNFIAGWKYYCMTYFGRTASDWMTYEMPVLTRQKVFIEVPYGLDSLARVLSGKRDTKQATKGFFSSNSKYVEQCDQVKNPKSDRNVNAAKLSKEAIRYWNGLTDSEKNHAFKRCESYEWHSANSKNEELKTNSKIKTKKRNKREIPDETINAVADRLKKYSDDLTDLYKWPLSSALAPSVIKARFTDTDIPEWVDKLRGVKDTNIYEQSLKLRSYLSRALTEEMTPDRRSKYAAWIVHDWGKIPGGKTADSEAALLEKVIAAEADHSRLDRVASWSKYLAFKYPQEYAIYDERVIYSLNWLLFSKNSDYNCFFPSPGGRNSVMNLLDYELLIYLSHSKLGYTYLSEALEEDIKSRNDSGGRSSFRKGVKNKIFLDKTKSYLEFTRIMKSIADNLYDLEDNDRLLKTEMILFSIADKDIALEVMTAYKNSCI